ncbi:MAG: beta-galactosidase, partial [Muribaculaceae bacterium]|nr:beta-galactosidase [Muribaculaceae bacterium]
MKSLQGSLWAAILFCFGAVAASAQYQPGALYSVMPERTKALALAADGSAMTVAASESDRPDRYWTLTELSGSWRLINPFSNLALRAEGDAVVSGENNGSDEAQLWRLEPVGSNGAVRMVPVNRPDVAAAVQGSGIVLVPKARGTRFTVNPARKAGFSPELTYRFRSVAHPDMVIGNGDNGENNTVIRIESVDDSNRGQYWNVKMLDLDNRVIAGAFYDQNFDDGGSNASINHLLQWPATEGVWKNACFRFEPVGSIPGQYVI